VVHGQGLPTRDGPGAARPHRTGAHSMDDGTAVALAPNRLTWPTKCWPGPIGSAAAAGAARAAARMPAAARAVSARTTVRMGASQYRAFLACGSSCGATRGLGSPGGKINGYRLTARMPRHGVRTCLVYGILGLSQLMFDLRCATLLMLWAGVRPLLAGDLRFPQHHDHPWWGSIADDHLRW